MIDNEINPPKLPPPAHNSLHPKHTLVDLPAKSSGLILPAKSASALRLRSRYLASARSAASLTAASELRDQSSKTFADSGVSIRSSVGIAVRRVSVSSISEIDLVHPYKWGKCLGASCLIASIRSILLASLAFHIRSKKPRIRGVSQSTSARSKSRETLMTFRGAVTGTIPPEFHTGRLGLV